MIVLSHNWLQFQAWWSRTACTRVEPSSDHGWTPPHNKLLLAVHANPSAAASICGGLCSSLQGPPGHFQGSLHALVPANKSSSVDEDAALNPTELWQRFVTNAAPLFQQGQPATGRQKEAEFTDGHYMVNCSSPANAWLRQTHPLAFINVVNIFHFFHYNYLLTSTQSCFFCVKILPSMINAGFAFDYMIFECISILAYISDR